MWPFASGLKESADNYLWLLQQFALLYIQVDLFRSRVIIIADEKALVSNIYKNIFENNNLLCVWYINKNVLMS